MKYGLMIRNARLAKGYSQKDLATIMGVSQPNIVKLEAEKTKPNISTLEKIAAALNKRLTIKFEPKEATQEGAQPDQKIIIGSEQIKIG